MIRLGVSRSLPVEEVAGPDGEEVANRARMDLMWSLAQDLQKHHGIRMSSNQDNENGTVTIGLRTHALTYDQQRALRQFISEGRTLRSKEASRLDVPAAAWAALAISLLDAIAPTRRFTEDE